MTTEDITTTIVSDIDAITADTTTNRKLASIQRILDLQPIPGADAIEVATVLGWKVVVKKGEFKVNDLCVYAEIDSILPALPQFEFLAKANYRIKTIRLRGQVSQGIALPISTAFKGKMAPMLLEEGMDVTEMLGIVKYEPLLPACLGGTARGNFPSFLKKTDETRIQAEPRLLDRWRGVTIRAHEKLDGSSMTVYLNGEDYGVCSRNLNLKETEENSFWQTANKLQLREKLTVLGRNLAIQGELIGPGIQKNKYALRELELHVFNVFDIDSFAYLDDVDAKEVAAALGLKWCPFVMDVTIDENTTVDSMLVLAEGRSALNPNQEREGLVWRPVQELVDDRFGRVSFKTISNKFLLNGGE